MVLRSEGGTEEATEEGGSQEGQASGDDGDGEAASVGGVNRRVDGTTCWAPKLSGTDGTP